METNQSDFVRLSLIQTPEQCIMTVEVPVHTARTEIPAFLETPNITIGEGTSIGYRVLAIARIGAASFECILTSPEEQEIDKPRIDWIWNCKSDKVGSHYINLSLSILWKSIDGKPIGEHQIWHNQFRIEVFEPWITKGQLSIASLISGFLGTILSASWLYERFKEAKIKMRKADIPRIQTSCKS